MTADASTTTLLAPLEAHADTQVKHLLAIADVIRALQSTEAQYAKRYAALPFQTPESTAETLKQLPQLREVCSCFSLLVHEFAALKAGLASELLTQVLEPLEEFTMDHGEKARHVLSELYELLQKEKAFDLAYQKLHEGCNASSSQEDSASSEDETSSQLQQTHMLRLLRKRDAERLTIQQWITALHFAGQRYQTQLTQVVSRTTSIYERMIASSRTLLSRLQEQLNQEIASSSSSIGEKSNNSASKTFEESWDDELVRYDCHVALTTWMSSLFRQIIPVEQNTAKLLQKVAKLDRVADKESVGFGLSFLTGLSEYHDILTVNIANPIVRTLKLSKEKQERMQKELVKSLSETVSLVADARARVDTRTSASKEYSDHGKIPIRRDSMTSSETSDLCESDNNEHDSSANGFAQDFETASDWTPELSYLQTMERKLALQTQEMTSVLEQTSYLAVKTMELMVQDHIKRVCMALDTLSDAMHMEPNEAKQTVAHKQPWDHIAEMLSIHVATDFVAQVKNSSQQVHFWNHGNKTHAGKTQVAGQHWHRRRFDLATDYVGKAVTGLSVCRFAANTIPFTLRLLRLTIAAPFRFTLDHLPPSQEERVAVAVIFVAIFVMINICMASTQVQQSWRDLTDIQRSNAKDLEQIVKLAVDVCTSK
ncbi:hypothetical protein PHYBOEH_011073 [Phytophthora boehmeriae]|uniref:Uncharacterized protein n=1 Tax=Phytophthora boehmeriae TaxID=109152 RepID=A0A8T1WWE9_9STRA|nr:hypothetical protein PHYBOEH_011073 [Phytophthora boehmeriae]